MSSRRIYTFLLLATAAGYGWLLLASRWLAEQHDPVCLVKSFTGLPCPSCGSTRSVLSLFHGDVAAALLWNPLGLVLSLFLLVLPAWLAYDFLSGKRTLSTVYVKAEQRLRKKWLAVPLVLLLLGNWIWSIHKGL